MTEIEKLYKNAGIEGEWRDYRVKNGKIYEGRNPKNRNIRLCPPKFTAEKQLELIKFLFQKSVYYDVDVKGNYWFHITDDCYTYHYSKFETALANIINEMWQDLTAEEQQQIKEIQQ